MRHHVLLILLTIAASLTATAEEAPNISDRYPGLLRGALSTATFGDLPKGVLVQWRTEKVMQKQLDDLLAGSAPEMKPQLEKNALFLVQEIATKQLLLMVARDAAVKNGTPYQSVPDAKLISEHLQAVAAGVTVTDAEVRTFYDENQDMFGGASFDKVVETLREYVRKQKRQEVVNEYIRGLGRSCGVVIAKEWGKRQAALAFDNPVDKARLNKRPTMVDFGAQGCRACDLMEPILKAMKEEYAGRADIVFVHVHKEQVLALRFGVQNIPVQVFFDAEGREVFRHEGFFSREDIEKKLRELGVK